MRWLDPQIDKTWELILAGVIGPKEVTGNGRSRVEQRRIKFLQEEYASDWGPHFSDPANKREFSQALRRSYKQWLDIATADDIATAGANYDRLNQAQPVHAGTPTNHQVVPAPPTPPTATAASLAAAYLRSPGGQNLSGKRAAKLMGIVALETVHGATLARKKEALDDTIKANKEALGDTIKAIDRSELLSMKNINSLANSPTTSEDSADSVAAEVGTIDGPDDYDQLMEELDSSAHNGPTAFEARLLSPVGAKKRKQAPEPAVPESSTFSIGNKTPFEYKPESVTNTAFKVPATNMFSTESLASNTTTKTVFKDPNSTASASVDKENVYTPSSGKRFKSSNG